MMGVRRPQSVVRFGGRNKRLPEPLVRKAGLAASVYNRARRAKRPTKKVGPDIETGGSSPPGSSRRAGGYSPVLRLTADEMSLPLFPCPKKFTFWDTTLLPRGTFWVRVPRRPARGRPKTVFLLLACCTQEEDAGPAYLSLQTTVTQDHGNVQRIAPS